MSKEKKDLMPFYDLITAVVLLAACAAFSYESLFMPRPGGWLTAPGLPPLAIFVSMAVMALFLLIDALKNNGVAILKEEWGRIQIGAGLFSSLYRQKIVLLILIFFIYYVLLARFLPFEISTFLYLFVTLRILYKRSLLMNILLPVIVVTVIYFVFVKVFGVVLPGIPYHELKFW